MQVVLAVRPARRGRHSRPPPRRPRCALMPNPRMRAGQRRGSRDRRARRPRTSARRSASPMRAGVVDRIGELRRVLVGADADHQGDAPFFGTGAGPAAGAGARPPQADDDQHQSAMRHHSATRQSTRYSVAAKTRSLHYLDRQPRFADLTAAGAGGNCSTTSFRPCTGNGSRSWTLNRLGSLSPTSRSATRQATASRAPGLCQSGY